MVQLLIFLMTLLVFAGSLSAQEDLPQQRWFAVETPNFRVFSQLSRAQTERRAAEFEQWRYAATQLLGNSVTTPLDPVRTHLYLFEDREDFQPFAAGQEAAYYYSSPRTGFLLIEDSGSALDLAQHHYAHFLINNRPQGVPRWYEEGMANYLSRLSLDGEEVELRAFAPGELEVAMTLNVALSLEALLYDDAALASPRLIQIANLKSAMFLQFLLHAHELEGFMDRRGQLQSYLGFLLQGRTERFAFDQSFEGSLSNLEREYERYLEATLAAGDVERTLLTLLENPRLDAVQSDPETITMALGELALHAGSFELAGNYFGALVAAQTGIGRAWSGLGDAIRLQALPDVRPDVESYYLQALAVDSNDYQLLLDYGQYLDTELASCARNYSEAERQRMETAMRTSFERAMQSGPDSAEVNLSYAQVFLREGQDWQLGLPYQNRALAALPADTFIMEQAIAYALLAGRFEEARRHVARLARPLHFWGVPEWVADLQSRVQTAERGDTYDACAGVSP